MKKLFVVMFMAAVLFTGHCLISEAAHFGNSINSNNTISQLQEMDNR
jgi:hypothetical protein